MKHKKTCALSIPKKDRGDWYICDCGAEEKKENKMCPLYPAKYTNVIRIERKWSMPSRWTFTIPPIKELLDYKVRSFPGNWIDPFCGKNGEKYANWCNDIEQGAKRDALTFLKKFSANQFEGAIYDPPYSITQARKYGKAEFASMKYWVDCKNEIARIIKPGGKVICFGWNSMGLGKNRGFEMTRILLVPHGGSKNDTIVTVETKMN